MNEINRTWKGRSSGLAKLSLRLVQSNRFVANAAFELIDQSSDKGQVIPPDSNDSGPGDNLLHTKLNSTQVEFH